MNNIISVTPEMAKEYLSKNPSNRAVSKLSVSFYAKQMVDGDWVENGETIKIAEDGTLIDGQNRLHAVIAANIPVDLEFRTGIKKEYITTIDTGKARSAADILSMNKIPYYAATASAVKLIMAWDKGAVRLGEGTPQVKFSNSNVLGFVNLNKNEIISSAKWSSPKGLNALISRPKIIALHYLFSRIDNNSANYFFSDLESGVGLKAGDPVLVLRNRLIENTSKSERTGKMSGGEMLGIIIKAWNYRRNSQTIKKLKMGKDEAFDKII